MSTFAVQLHHALRDNAMTQQGLADALRDEHGLAVSRNEVRAWLEGGHCPQWDRVLPALERLFGIPVEQFVLGHEPTTPSSN